MGGGGGDVRGGDVAGGEGWQRRESRIKGGGGEAREFKGRFHSILRPAHAHIPIPVSSCLIAYTIGKIGSGCMER